MRHSNLFFEKLFVWVAVLIVIVHVFQKLPLLPCHQSSHPPGELNWVGSNSLSSSLGPILQWENIFYGLITLNAEVK